MGLLTHLKDPQQKGMGCQCRRWILVRERGTGWSTLVPVGQKALMMAWECLASCMTSRVKPGVRAELASYLQDYIEGWVDVPGRATLDQNVSPVHVSADA